MNPYYINLTKLSNITRMLCLSKFWICKLTTLGNKCFQTKEAKDELQYFDFSLQSINKVTKIKI